MVYILTTNLPLTTIKIKKTNPNLSISPLPTNKIEKALIYGAHLNTQKNFKKIIIWKLKSNN